MYNNFFPEKELDTYRITGTEKITVPAGSFTCTVVEGFLDEEKYKYWMINEKPGIYAKVITEGLDWRNKLSYTIRELEEIKQK